MIHVATSANRHLYGAALAEMHRQRKAIFIDAYGWKLEVRDGGEYDAYDDARAIYFLALGDDGLPHCTTRLRPADDGSIIEDHFPHLLAPGEPRLDDGRTWEFARAVAVGVCRGTGGAKRKAELRLAMLEYALAHGCERFVGFMDVTGIPHLDSTGWRYRYLGLPAPYAEGTAIAFEVEVSAEAIEHKREVWGFGAAPVLATPERRLRPVVPAGGLRAAG